MSQINVNPPSSPQRPDAASFIVGMAITALVLILVVYILSKTFVSSGPPPPPTVVVPTIVVSPVAR